MATSLNEAELDADATLEGELVGEEEPHAVVDASGDKEEDEDDDSDALCDCAGDFDAPLREGVTAPVGESVTLADGEMDALPLALPEADGEGLYTAEGDCEALLHCEALDEPLTDADTVGAAVGSSVGCEVTDTDARGLSEVDALLHAESDADDDPDGDEEGAVENDAEGEALAEPDAATEPLPHANDCDGKGLSDAEPEALWLGEEEAEGAAKGDVEVDSEVL